MDIAPSDVEMAPDDVPEDLASAESASEEGSSSPPPSSSPAHHSPIPIDDVDTPLPVDLLVPENAVDDAVSSNEAPVAGESTKGKKSKPSSNVAAAGPSAKPKSSKSAAPRASSPSPPPPPARRPLETIRLDIQLGGPEDYEVNVSELAKATGQRQATPVPEVKIPGDSSDESDGDDEPGDDKVKLGDKVKTDEKETLTAKKRKRRHHASEYYDTADPFIDDSELAQDERTFFAQTKQKGFYVSSGQVALLNKAPQRKPKSKKVNILAPSASVTAALSTATLPLPALSASAGPSNGSVSAKARLKVEDGTADAPIALLSDAEDATGKLKRKMSETQSVASSGGDGSVKKRRKTVEIQPFHPDLEAAIDVLKEAIAKENWETKGKFPPSLKPVLAQVALKAVILGEYDDNFFNLMPRLFPYNKFTMTKLVKRTIWRDHTNLLVDRQNSLIEELRVLADEGFPKAKEEWEKSVVQWEKRQERAKAEPSGEPVPGVAHSTEGSPVVSDQATPGIGTAPLEARPSLDDGADHEDGGAPGKGKDSHPPAKRYRLTDQMKQIIWQLVCLSNECCRIENEKNQLENSNQIVSDQGVRKNLYQRIVGAFPDGWLSSGQISREVSVMKKKYEKESMENE
ncbi:uncharacterized protein TRAVEDRAFT_21578 [Trametes versicolor FP-101664 SS1]|uniref:uncharacterized protein n=1 Tax=Trametes versicolor (strain FP-101664) TaxID=717944 RepID=UPI0004622D28|nr:uncharacterized protein TRAVEDRAFT_21578 [Trametes versicolor FP-101664 SS1]EIW56386.1 hypothetical protein TRAVEDRAFT_21578 [Trametes versicolor FP-101664 SS1]